MKKLILILSVLLIGCVRLPITRELYEPQVDIDNKTVIYECMRLKEPLTVYISYNMIVEYAVQDLKLHATTSVYRYYISKAQDVFIYGGGLAIKNDTKKIYHWCNVYGLLGKLPILNFLDRPIYAEYEIVFIKEPL